MTGLFSFMASSGPVVHISPQVLFTVAGWPITNSILYGWISAVIICILFIWVARLATVHPKGGFVQIVELGVSFIVNFVEGAFDNKKSAQKYTAFFVTTFFFILFNNWFGLLPIAGDSFQVHNMPLLRTFTADLNATFAMAALMMILVYVSSVREFGGFGHYMRHFFIGNPKNPFYFFVGCLEMLTDLTRVISLSLRLFLNVTIGEIVIAVFSYLGHILAPVTALPFTLLELFICALQAYIFTVLGTMYLAVAANSANHQPDHDLTSDGVPETMELTTEAGRR